jgi:hypothetical protein
MDQQEKIKKRRVRKKTVEIDTIDKLNMNMNHIEKTPIKTDEETFNSFKKDDMNHSQISFGKFNITVKKSSGMTPEDLRKFYDEKFKINDSDKSSKLMIQNDNLDIVYKPIMETDINESKGNFVEKKQEVKIPKKIDKKQKILSKFIDGTKESWPERTDILCWWCAHNFDTTPLPCPINYNHVNKHYKVNGIFCSWPCVAAHSIEKYTNITLVYQLMRELEHVNCKESCDCENIRIAPPKYILKDFGGYMSIKDYRNLSKDKKILISTESLSYINQDIVEIL